jgi:CRP/FNR family transcriptional regulator, global nitrogen regulator
MLRHDTGSFAATTAPSGFGLDDFESAGIRVVERRFRAKDVIFTPGDPDDQLYFVLEGTVRLYKIYGDYKEATTALLRDTGVFGKLSLVEGGAGRMSSPRPSPTCRWPVSRRLP